MICYTLPRMITHSCNETTSVNLWLRVVAYQTDVVSYYKGKAPPPSINNITSETVIHRIGVAPHTQLGRELTLFQVPGECEKRLLDSGR